MSLPVPLAPIGLLLTVACVIAIVTRRLGLPYSAGLVAAGLAFAFIPGAPAVSLSRDLIFDVFLPPLVFEAALQLQWNEFRRELPLTLTLAFFGVALAGLVVAAGLHWLLGWSWLGAALFAVLIAATDPVSVIAAFREIKAERRLALLVESESLLNDGVVAVAFAVLVGIATGASPAFASVVPAFLWTMFGGILIGGGLAALILYLAGRTNDHLVEIALTTIAAWASFIIAERLDASGILASLTAGIMVGNWGWKGAISREGQPHVLAAWEFFAFLANSFVFILIGIVEAALPIEKIGLVTTGSAILLVLLGRAVAIYPLANVFRPTRLSIPAKYQHVLFWGGLRGALALALALTVPTTVAERPVIIVTAFLVVAFSIFVQGLTMPWLVQQFGLVQKRKGRRVAAAKTAP